jgi:hypothetical protein
VSGGIRRLDRVVDRDCRSFRSRDGDYPDIVVEGIEDDEEAALFECKNACGRLVTAATTAVVRTIFGVRECTNELPVLYPTLKKPILRCAERGERNG